MQRTKDIKEPKIKNKSIQEYTSLPKSTLIDFLQNSPLFGIKLDIQRDKSHARFLRAKI